MTSVASRAHASAAVHLVVYPTSANGPQDQ